MQVYWGVVTFLFGIVVGSFLNVLIYRLPRELNIAKGYSFCPACHHRLYPVDLVPVFSWLFLRRRCRYCGEPISWVYPAVELANALLWVGCYIAFGLTGEALAAAGICSALIVVAFCDWQHREIPDSMNITIALMGVILVFVSNALALKERLIGAICVSGVLFLLAFVTGGRAMGGGDIKLMAALGLCLGWKLTVFTTFLGALLGSITFVVLSKTKSKLGREVPFGTFLAAAGVIALFWGDQLLRWYFGLLGM